MRWTEMQVTVKTYQDSWLLGIIILDRLFVQAVSLGSRVPYRSLS